MRPQKFDSWESIENYGFVTLLTEFGNFLPGSEVYRVFEPYFSVVEIEYFDIEQTIRSLGYLRSDLKFTSCQKNFKDNYIFLLDTNFSQQALWKSPDTEDFIITCEIRIKENRRYDFWWDYVKSMKTKKKKLSGKLTLNNHPTYKVEEVCLYHPQISYQRNGMNDKFYDDDIWSNPDIVDKQVVVEHINKYAEDKVESTNLLLKPFVNGETFLRYW